MKSNDEMTAEKSLQIINETIDNNRCAIAKNSGLYFILWGSLLTIFSIVVLVLWRFTGSPAWNFLWFAMPVVGYPLDYVLKRHLLDVPRTFVSDMLGRIWSAFGVFAISSSVLALTLAPMNVSLVIILLFGFAEAVSGILLKSWPIIIGGALTGIAGSIIAALVVNSFNQMLIFVFAGIVLTLTGLLIRCLKR